VTAQTVARYEHADTEPTADMVERFAEVLGFPIEYLSRDDPPLIAKERPSFRAQRSMTASLRDRALGSASQALEYEQHLSAVFRLRSPNVPDLHHLDPESAAMALREHWGIGLRPVPNMIHLLEKHGVRVFSIDEECTSLRAFCLWNEDQPFVFTSMAGTVELSRFNAAHELAHLVLHRSGDIAGKKAEDDANDFASAFLMPRESVLGACNRGMSFDSIVVQKKRWGVSASALTQRLKSEEIGLLTNWEHKRLSIELSRRGRANEPNAIEARETSHVLAAAQRELRREGKSLASITPFFNPFDVYALSFRLGPAVVWEMPT
jgi:Zn-dependent peptidase ImmA (M78 family)